jgi:hypothetical protein
MYLEQKYIGFVSGRLERFKRISNGGYNFRCPICLDSERHKNKARGYLLPRKGTYWYFCHNCTASLPFQKLLKTLDLPLHRDYVRELIRDRSPASQVEEPVREAPEGALGRLEEGIAGLKRVVDLGQFHYARLYINGRKLPKERVAELLYCDKFQTFTNEILPGKFEKVTHDDARIIIPFRDMQGKLFGYQGRSLDHNSYVKYISIVADEGRTATYGLDRLDPNKEFFAFEGPFNSMFIDNSMAACGSSIVPSMLRLGFNRDHSILVFDNSKRTREVVSKIEEAIDVGFRVVIWPDYIEGEDVNDMVKDYGMTASEVSDIMHKNVFQGLRAKNRFAKWKRI